jgi:hypothetical protein
LEAAAFAHLSAFGLRLVDIKVESRSADPAEHCLACWLLDLGSVVRFRLDRVEVWSGGAKLLLDASLAARVASEALEAVQAVSQLCLVSSHSITTTLQGVLADGELAATLANYFRAVPDGEPRLVPAGISFAWPGTTTEGERGSIVLEPSASIAGAAFLRVSSEHPGSLAVADALERARLFFAGSLARLGFDPEWSR